MCLFDGNLPNNADDAPAYIWGSFNIENLMQTLLLLLLAKPSQSEIEDAIESNDDQNEDISIEARFVDCYDKAEPFHQ